MNTETISISTCVVLVLSFFAQRGVEVYRQLWFKSHDFFDKKIIWFKTRLKSVI